MSAEKEAAQPTQQQPILAVRIRGTVGDNIGTELTMKSLGLPYKFNARVLPSSPETIGMLRRAKDLVTWGELEPETLEVILRKRADWNRDTLSQLRGLDEEFVKSMFDKSTLGDLAKSIVSGETSLQRLWKAGVKPTFRLHPPKGGFKRSTRRSYNSHGELGYRGLSINQLAKRMV